MPKEVINPPNVHRPRGYSHAFKVGNTVYVAGQAPYDLEGNLVGKGDLAKQAEQAYENLKRVLEAAGATMADLVMVTWYLRNVDDFAKTGDATRKYFQRPYPPGTAVGVTRLMNPDALIEVDAVAVIG